MTSGFADAGLKEFALALDELSEGLEFLRLSSRVRPRLGAILDWSNAVGEALQLTKRFIALKTVELSPVHRGLVVVLSGVFEQLVRRIVRDAVIQININAGDFDSVPEGVKIQNIFYSGRALCSIREPLDHISVDHNAVVSALATCKPGTQKFTLNAEAFGMFITNLTPSHLSEVCRTIGVSLDWDHFGRIKTFEGLLGTKGVRATGNAVADRLGDIIKLRNRIAHTGTGGITVTEEEISSHIAYFRLLGPSLADQVAATL